MWAMIERTVERMVEQYTAGTEKEWNLEALYDQVSTEILRSDAIQLSDLQGKSQDELKQFITDKARQRFQEKL
ncbi:hypothetical protein QP221_10325, partial [Streptococcus mitis]|nr:hypothetical protein [Streptococcus mitis]